MAANLEFAVSLGEKEVRSHCGFVSPPRFEPVTLFLGINGCWVVWPAAKISDRRL
jgi:hypothetical protein